jgi:hypothetical protein
MHASCPRNRFFQDGFPVTDCAAYDRPVREFLVIAAETAHLWAMGRKSKNPTAFGRWAERHGKGNKELAAALGIGAGYVSNLRSGRDTPGGPLRLAIAGLTKGEVQPDDWPPRPKLAAHQGAQQR